MDVRIDSELELLRRYFPALQFLGELRWLRLPGYKLPKGIWDRDRADIAFQIPIGYPGQKPYGFYVNPRLNLLTGANIDNSTPSTEPPFEGDWLKFSWDMPEWRPTADLQTGTNLLNFALSFADRLQQGA